MYQSSSHLIIHLQNEHIFEIRAINIHLCYFLLDDVFLPKDIDLDSTEMDETEREVEYFKRYVH